MKRSSKNKFIHVFKKQLSPIYSIRIANSGRSGHGVVRAIKSHSGLQHKNWTMLPLALRIPPTQNAWQPAKIIEGLGS
jgi:hypothetical protein